MVSFRNINKRCTKKVCWTNNVEHQFYQIYNFTEQTILLNKLNNSKINDYSANDRIDLANNRIDLANYRID